MKAWIINNLQPAVLCEQDEQRILGNEHLMCSKEWIRSILNPQDESNADYFTSGQISKQNPHFCLMLHPKALQKSIQTTPALNVKGIVHHVLLFQTCKLLFLCMGHKALLNISCKSNYLRKARLYYPLLIQLSGKQIDLWQQTEE